MVNFEIFDEGGQYSLSGRLKHCNNPIEEGIVKRSEICNTIEHILIELFNVCDVDMSIGELEYVFNEVLKNFKTKPLKL